MNIARPRNGHALQRPMKEQKKKKERKKEKKRKSLTGVRPLISVDALGGDVWYDNGVDKRSKDNTLTKFESISI